MSPLFAVGGDIVKEIRYCSLDVIPDAHRFRRYSRFAFRYYSLVVFPVPRGIPGFHPFIDRTSN